MKKQTVTQGAVILMIGFIIQLIIGMANHFIIVRILGQEGMSIFMLIIPTLTLLVTLTSMGLPVAITTLISRENLRQKNILSVALIITGTSTLVISIILFLLARPLAIKFLRDERTYLPLLTIAPLIFFSSFSDILQAYFRGKQNMTPPTIALLFEQGVRIITSIVFLSIMFPHGIVYGVFGVLLASILGKLVSILILQLFFFKNLRQNYPAATLKPTRLRFQHFKDVIEISIPTMGSTLIHSFFQFLEPIIVIQCLAKIGYSGEVSSRLYTSISGFAIPLLILPLFISNVICQSIIPTISRAYSNRNFSQIHHYLNTTFKLSFSLSGLYMVFVVLFSFNMMDIAFNTTAGARYLPLIAPFYLLLFIQAPLSATLETIDEAKAVLKYSFISSLIKIGLMFILIPIPNFNIYGFIVAIIVQIIILTAQYYHLIKKKIGYQANSHSVVNGILAITITYLVGHYILTIYSNLNTLLQVVSIFLTYLAMMSISDLLPTKFLKKQKKMISL